MKLRSCWEAAIRTYVKRSAVTLCLLSQADSKAALCALRVIRRVPDLMDNFTSKAKSLLQINNHGVLLAGITLITEMCAADEAICQTFRKVGLFEPFRVTKADESGNGSTGKTPQIASNNGLQS